MKKVLVSLMIVALAGVTFVGCASKAEVLASPDATFPLEITEDMPAFVFPISLHIGGDADVIGTAVAGMIISEFGAAVIPGQPLYDLVGNLSWTLGEGMRRQVSNGQFTLSGGADDVADNLKMALDLIFTGLEEIGAIEPGYRFKYIIALHCDSAGGGAMPGLQNIVIFGGVYDIETNNILAYIESEESLPDVTDTLVGTVPPKFVNVLKALIAGEPQ